ncbi:MAG: NifB/NifX family molybdenum-iron cluster-binding protein [Methanomicrobiaceae archaeon]|nr:NifB/NifX family molybdenum-iron cluster-binding protein [Methanomicrobiaceae archaeon]
MKMCITAKGDTPDAQVEERFGRAPFFIFHESEQDTYTAETNVFADAAGGVGPRSAQVLIDHGATVLITGQLGGNARRALEGAGIEVYQAVTGSTVREAVTAYRENRLNRIL